jgi:hypothetical protein
MARIAVSPKGDTHHIPAIEQRKTYDDRFPHYIGHMCRGRLPARFDPGKIDRSTRALIGDELRYPTLPTVSR